MIPRTDTHASNARYELAQQFTGISLRRAVLTALILATSGVSLLVLGWWLRSHPFEGFDTNGVETISAWSWPGADATLDTIAALFNAQASALVGLMMVAILFVSGHARLAVGVAIAGVIVAAFAITADHTLGEWVGRSRPDPAHPGASFPSGHALGTVAFYGFALYLGVTHKLRRLFLVPLFAIVAIAIGAAGLSRIYQEAHWPTDVIGGYLLGLIALFVLIHFHRWMESIRWLARPILGRDVAAVPMKGVKIADSYGSVVMLDREAGTATKIFNPPFIIRLIYWMAFQAKFPYDANPSALRAAKHRRDVAGYLTEFRFGKNLVAPIIDIGCIGGRPTIVSTLIVGEEAPNDEAAREFLTEATMLLASAGLPIWQLNPSNPHAHTNLIRTPDGDQFIVDFESAVATPFPARNQILSAARRGNLPVFDDVDFDRLRAFVQVNEEEIRAALGSEKFVAFQESIVEAEACTQGWQGAELRIASRVIQIVYKFFNWKAIFVKSRDAVKDSDIKAEAFLAKGLETWLEEGRITPERAEELKAELRTDEAHEAMRHLGANLAITAVFRFPFGSIIRPFWTLYFIGRGTYRALRGGGKKCWGFLKLHNPLVVLISIVPGCWTSA
ncbi:MAG: phosphatase PAP2 family protein [Chloroflexi bacterium]|nr:phosphatase PAP2 family protein [Chloroflexota bacterium]